jgi:hypothetical protein
MKLVHLDLIPVQYCKQGVTRLFDRYGVVAMVDISEPCCITVVGERCTWRQSKFNLFVRDVTSKRASVCRRSSFGSSSKHIVWHVITNFCAIGSWQGVLIRPSRWRASQHQLSPLLSPDASLLTFLATGTACGVTLRTVLYSSVSQSLWVRGPVNSFFIRRGLVPNKFARKYLSNFF